ncbi:MAG: hypothetical protein J7M19_01030 [Planctomycetes bacterium]|nr:hypothetical protein [Planctomycetota bacterium]
MSDLATILRARRRVLANAVMALRHESRLKTAFIAVFALAFWAALFEAFREGFLFISQVQGFETFLIAIVFALFFLSLLVMLVFSNAVLFYSSLYNSRETNFLLTLPISEESLFAYKLIETLMYSSWAFLYLGVPIILAYGYTSGVPWYFYPAALVMFVVFVAIPASIGSLLAILFVNFVPRSRLRVFLAVLAAAFLLTVLAAIKYASAFSASPSFAISDISRITGKLAFSQNPWLPSLWLSKAILSLGHSRPSRALFYLLVILSNSIFFASIAAATSRRLFWRSFSKSHSSAARYLRSRHKVLSRAIHRLFFFLPREIRIFLTKDLKTFLRDPSQWSQVLIFFGVLAIYIANIRSLPYNLGMKHARSTISLLNLAATSLVLSTFTGRFIFPLVSLEGKKFWVLGLAPVKRKQILYGKFFFAFFGSLLISEALILLSNYILEFPLSMVVCHAVLVLAICAGLSAISVGLGARYPNLKEDNAAKIVAGFGGTLNLIVSMLYIAVMMVTVALPYHTTLAQFAAGAPGQQHYKILGAYLALSLALGTLTSVFFLSIGWAKFERLEF